MKNTSLCFLFQFHKGTIRTCVTLEVIHIKYLDFNSIKVQLEPLQGEIDSLEVLNFNSIKVQLELKLLLDFLGAQHISIP